MPHDIALGAEANVLTFQRVAERNVRSVVTIAAIAAPAQLGPWISAGVGTSWCVFLVSASLGVVRGLGASTDSRSLAQRK